MCALGLRAALSKSLRLAFLGLFFGLLIPSAFRFLITYCWVDKFSEAALANNLASSFLLIASSYLVLCFC